MPTLINSYSLSSVIGIGTHTPNENLTVVGNISASGNVYGTAAVFDSVSAIGSIRADSITDTHGGALVKKKTFPIIGNGLAREFTLNHNFDTYGILIQVYDYDTKETVICYSKNTDTNNTLINTGTTLNVGVTGYLVVLLG